MLCVHDVITIAREPPVQRYVLWVAPDGSEAALVDRSDPGAMPYLVDMDEVDAALAAEAWTVAEGRMPNARLDHEIPDSHRMRRDNARKVVEMIVSDDLPAAFDKNVRAKRVGEAVQAFGLSRPTVTAYVCRFFQSGMSADALVPYYARCGAPGKVRKTVTGAPKRGRPPAPGHPKGCNVTERMRHAFNLAVDKTYQRDRRHSLMTAWDFCIRRFLTCEVKDPATGKTTFEPLEEYRESGLPTKEQFIYWVRQDRDKVDLDRKRAGPRVWDMAKKPKVGTATSRAPGPGSRFEIDATVLDIYVRSRGNRHRLVGRPTLYVVIDVFSRLIVGIYIGLEHPSWVAAMMALANAVEDKVDYCRRFGIEISPEEWPAQHICGTLLGDRGELESLGIDAVLDVFNMKVENAAPYRADWKGVVETRFKLLQAAFAPYLDGYVEKDFRARGGHDYREQAVLDIDDVTRVIIRLVRYYNNFHELKKYPRHPGQVQDGVPSVPIDLWNWGIATKSGTLRKPDIARFKFALMPRATARATVEGLRFQGRYYSCDEAIGKRWFTEARNGRFDVAISYDKRDVNNIYVHEKNEQGFFVAELTKNSQECRDLTGWEHADLHREAARLSANRRDAQQLRRAETNTEIVRINEAAKADHASSPVETSLRAQVQGARSARALELAMDRPGEVARTSPHPGPEQRTIEKSGPASSAVPETPRAPETNVSAPSMAESLAMMRARIARG